MKQLLQTLLLALFSFQCLAANAPVDRATELRQVLDTIASRYAYLAFDKGTFDQLRMRYLSAATEPLSNSEYVQLLERLADEFHDNHLQLNVNLANSYRLVPSGTALAATWRNGKAVITAIAPSHPSFLNGAQPGDVIIGINGEPPDIAVAKRLSSHIDHTSSAARHWALNSLLAGRRNEITVLDLQGPHTTRIVTIPAGQWLFRSTSELSFCRLPDNTQYIRINDSLGRTALIREFQQIFLHLKNASRIILDLRDTPSGGNSVVARAILGHFISDELPYQKHELPQDEKEYGVPRRWLELVSPIAPRLTSDVQVLVGPWTGSMGEGLAIGFDATRAGRVLGTRMVGLRGAISCVNLPSLGNRTCLNMPTERLFHVRGTPREEFVPVGPTPQIAKNMQTLCQ